MKKITQLIFTALLITSCEYEYQTPLYNVDDIVIIKPDSSVVKIFDYTSWADHTKYSVEYLDTNRVNVILEDEIINYKNN
tara:strand:- start:309 stop:548 length:240 start_codon:yes stop_codon:yes gene_type:complete